MAPTLERGNPGRPNVEPWRENGENQRIPGPRNRKAPKASAEAGETIRAGLRFSKRQNSLHPALWMLFIRYQANGEKEN